MIDTLAKLPPDAEIKWIKRNAKYVLLGGAYATSDRVSSMWATKLTEGTDAEALARVLRDIIDEYL
jgi:hypothetical protein